jgi:hypothetical protein
MAGGTVGVSALFRAPIRLRRLASNRSFPSCGSQIDAGKRLLAPGIGTETTLSFPKEVNDWSAHLPTELRRALPHPWFSAGVTHLLPLQRNVSPWAWVWRTPSKEYRFPGPRVGFLPSNQNCPVDAPDSNCEL